MASGALSSYADAPLPAVPAGKLRGCCRTADEGRWQGLEVTDVLAT